MSEYLNLRNVLDGVELPDYQRIGMRDVFLNKKMLLAFDTGTGKTFTYAGIVRGLLNRSPGKKHLLIIINDSIEQVPIDVANLTGVFVATCDGTAGAVGRLKRAWSESSIFCLTLEAMRVQGVVLFLFEHLMEIESLVIDEAHHCANWDSSDTAFMVRSLAQHIPYVVELSATPVTRTSKQYFRLMNLLDRTRSMHKDETRLGKYVERYLPVNREDYEMKGNYTSTLITVEPTLKQMQPQHGVVFRNIKGSGATPQVEALVECLKERIRDGKRAIVYVHYHDSRKWIEGHLDYHGITYTSLHGKIRKREDRTAALDRFKSGEVDVLITSVTESLNIEADVVIFYEFTTLVKQVVGRAHRGLAGKELEVVFIITKDTDEVEFFMKYIYARSLTIQKLLRKDYSELIAIGDKLKALELDD